MIERPSASGTYRRRYHKLRLTDIALNASIELCRVGLPNRPASRFPSGRRRLLRALASGGKPCIRGVTASSCRSHAGPCLDSRRGSGRRSRPGRDAPGDFARETSTQRSLGGESRRAAEPPRVSAVILVDTSAWIELLRATGHPPHVSLRHHLERRTPLAATEPIIMELLAGTRTSGERSRLRARLIALPRLTVRGSPTSSRWPNCTASAAAGAPPSER